MNADDRNPNDGGQPSATPASEQQPVRRAGVMPPSGSVPQRTAFRPVTGTHPTWPAGHGHAAHRAALAQRPSSHLGAAQPRPTPCVVRTPGVHAQPRPRPTVTPAAPGVGARHAGAPSRRRQ